MIEHTLDAARSLLHVRVKAPFTKEDFAGLANAVDPHIEKHGGLAGLLIEVTTFPGWENLGAMAAHFRFVRDHHKRIKRVAVVTDSALGTVAEKLASHFVAATIKRFAAGEKQAAEAWITAA
jgi:SpoIIAA-like